jgi:hypothetical protein
MDEIELLRSELNKRDIEIEQLKTVVAAFMQVMTEEQYATVRDMIELGDLSIPR